MTPTPPLPEPAVPDTEPTPAPAPPPPSSLKPVHLVAVAAAVAGGALATMLVMDAQPSAETTPRPLARATPAAPAPPRPDPSATAAATPAIDPAAPVKWSSNAQARWVHPSRTSAAFELHAERPVAVWNDTVTPTLVVRCTKGRVDAFIYTGSAARIEPDDDNHTVALAFDDRADARERWPDSVEHDALFAPDGRTLADRLSSARSFRFTFTPHNAGPATAHFDVRGLREKMAATKACQKK
jgi:hypothetical protein